ncbi:bifunctional nuclease family protein [candidate division KSB1 bacterium]|nr:bifunctional nuclease family protein [candidate division KSB1 bacterium]
MMIAVRVDRVTFDTTTNRFVVILKDDIHNRWLPIVVGSTEAQAIALQLEKISPPRPLTHDLMKNLLESMDVSVMRIIVTDLRENTYYATISIKSETDSLDVDARPSDAIALALRMQAPIFVEESVMKRAAIHDQDTEDAEERLAGVDRMEELNIQLNKAVKEERFEDAARLRDEILELKRERDPSSS